MDNGTEKKEMHNIREYSRKIFITANPHSFESLQTAALLRIADATEAIAQNHQQLLSDVEYWKGRADYWKKEFEAAQKQIAVFKGLATRYKNQINKNSIT